MTVVRLDRLGRNVRDILNLVHELAMKGASLRVLESSIDKSGPMGQVILTVLGMVAEMELSHLRNRQRVRIDAAKAAGVYKGRPITLDRARVLGMRDAGQGATAIARNLSCSRGAIYKIFAAASKASDLQAAA